MNRKEQAAERKLKREQLIRNAAHRVLYARGFDIYDKREVKGNGLFDRGTIYPEIELIKKEVAREYEKWECEIALNFEMKKPKHRVEM